ncbi:MAG: DUF4167 domain-containing protein [Amylibacter sp.]|nr:DUF4167 domain-containing protein [Amylibacter sp.]
MRSSNKSRSRNKNYNNNQNNNRRGNPANVLNRVFDSAGPEGKVRGTPQQIIDKYQSLAHDATLAGDRVAAENFLQHSEHYSRMLTDAQREIDERREAHEAQRQQNQKNHQQNQNQQQNQKPKDQQNTGSETGDEQPNVAGNANDLFPGTSEQPNLVETPESKPVVDAVKKPKRVRQPAKKVEITKPEAPKAEAPKPVAVEAEKPNQQPKTETAAE